jgi:hypothetical protein
MSMVLQPLHFIAMEVISMGGNADAVNAVVNMLSDKQRIAVIM